MILRSFCAPGTFRGRRLRDVATCAGVVRYRTPASWQARARSSRERSAARSTSVRGTGVTGMPRWVARSAASSFARRTRTPGTSRWAGAVTSGAGTGPLSSDRRWAAARPLSRARSPHASTAARYRASRLGARWPTRASPAPPPPCWVLGSLTHLVVTVLWFAPRLVGHRRQVEAVRRGGGAGVGPWAALQQRPEA